MLHSKDYENAAIFFLAAFKEDDQYLEKLEKNLGLDLTNFQLEDDDDDEENLKQILSLFKSI